MKSSGNITDLLEALNFLNDAAGERDIVKLVCLLSENKGTISCKF
jgi:hypothetical protein